MSDTGPENDPSERQRSSVADIYEFEMMFQQGMRTGFDIPQIHVKGTFRAVRAVSRHALETARNSNVAHRALTLFSRGETFLGDVVQRGLTSIHRVGNEGMDALGAHQEPRDHDLE